MSKRSFALLLAAFLMIGMLGAPTASATIFDRSTPATQAVQADDDFPLVSGLLEVLLRPGPQLTANRSFALPTSNVTLDGGILNDAFVLHCQAPDNAGDKLRVRWSDATGDHTWTLVAPVDLPACMDGETQSYDALMGGLCEDGTPAVANLHLEKTGTAQSASILIQGAGCSLDDGTAGPFTGDAQGCLAFGSDADACDNGGTSNGSSYPGDMTGSAVVDGVAFQFVLECNSPIVGDNLTVLWDGNTFELTDWDSPSCSDDTDYTAPNRKNPFDTQRGNGSGLCNGTPSDIGWTFEDGGEPSTNDAAAIEISSTDTCPGLDIEGAPSDGNLQVHPE